MLLNGVFVDTYIGLPIIGQSLLFFFVEASAFSTHGGRSSCQTATRTVTILAAPASERLQLQVVRQARWLMFIFESVRADVTVFG